MVPKLTPSKIYRTLYVSTRSYCDNKSIYQRDEEGPKPRVVHGQTIDEWRKPWIQRPGEWYSKLSLFYQKNPSSDIVNALQKIPELTWQDIKDWYANLKVIQEKENQKYLSERIIHLGSNLAAVHFFVYRKATIRLRGSEEWIAGDILTLKLPSSYVDGYFVEAVDCSNFHHNGIRYEGIENLSGLNFLKWLSLKGNKHVDVWCIDRIAGQNGKSLEYLNIVGCRLCVGCIYAIARMPVLKILVIHDPGDNIELQTALSILEEENPNLLIKIE